MTESPQPLIVGAGPVGLAAGLFLARQGRPPRVVELSDEPATQSKALAVNPRTLDLLEPTGVTQRMLEMGSPIGGMCFYRGQRLIGQVSLAGLHPKHPYMLALSQATTERLLADAFIAAGGKVERGVRLTDCYNVTDGVQATLEPAAGGASEKIEAPWLLAADGAHSTARQQLDIPFDGSTFKNEWYLADIPLRTTLPADLGHVFFIGSDVMLFTLRVVNDKRTEGSEAPLWRVLANRPDPLAYLQQAEQAGPAIWTSNFHVSHRLNESLAAGAVYFAGDAAHIHSPLGARGMNLGIEDAWVFAKLAKAGRLDHYNRLRLPVDRRVVREVEFLSRVASPESWFFRALRRFVFPRMINSPLRKRIRAVAAGLDHELPPMLTATSNGLTRRQR